MSQKEEKKLLRVSQTTNPLQDLLVYSQKMNIIELDQSKRYFMCSNPIHSKNKCPC